MQLMGKKHGISVEHLKTEKEKLEDKYLKNKLNDIILIYEKFENKIQGSFIDETDLLTILAENIDKVDILKDYPAKKILFIPDCNLGRWVEKQLPEKEFKVFSGGCPTHMRVRKEDVLKAKEEHPEAEFLVHPECLEEVVDLADYVGSTTGIMAYAKKSDKKEFIIGTEASIVQHLQYECPDKKFYLVSEALFCHNMRMTTLMDVLNTLEGTGGDEIIMSEELIKDSLKPIKVMMGEN